MSEDGTADGARAAEYESFFYGVSRSLVAQAFVLTGNLAEAQDLAQETMLRAWRSWDRVSRYDSPEAWARKVLHHLAVSRWRRLRVRRAHDALERPPVLPEPDAAYLDVVAAIAKLPPGPRRALVLFELVGLTGDEIAAELHVPAGTVRGWLSRARKSVAAELGAQLESENRGTQ